MKKRLLSSSPRLFTPEEATRTLPLVTAILADLDPLWRSVGSTRKRIAHLANNRELDPGNPYSDELTSMQDRLTRDSVRVEGYVDELREIGAEFRGSADAHVCFPSMLDGRLVYLSWCPGETEVTHWMELDGSFAERQSLLVAPASS